MKKLYSAALLASLLVSSAACGIPIPAAKPGEVVRADAARETAPDVSTDALSELVAGNTAFAFDLYGALRGQGGNQFLSPYSISQALAMTYAGARGETERQMADTLHFTLPQQELHPAFNALDLALASRGDERKHGRFRLHVANAIWGQKGRTFLDEFLETLARNYGAGLRVLDFATRSEEARQVINRWVSEQTEGRIENLIPQGMVGPLTKLVLTNAIYFDAAWQHPFQEDQTRQRPFYLLDGGEVEVPMMRQMASFGYAEGEEYQAVELPYVGGELSMVILLPARGELGAFEGTLDGKRVQALLQGLETRQVALTMPKFEYRSEFSLAQTLAAMGMPLAFSGEADFSGMDGTRDLFIQEVVHKAFVSVDEEGTEAAAATAVVMPTSAVPTAPVEVTVDHPFIFLIRDRGTGAVLFLGRVVDPS